MELGTDIGTPLRQARRERGLSLRQAAEELDVPIDVLADLEAGRVDAFGPHLHASAYARVYARYLGVDEQIVLGVAEPPPPDLVAVASPEFMARRRRLLGVSAALVGLGAVAAVVVVLLTGGGDETQIDLTESEDSDVADTSSEDDTGVLARTLDPRAEGPSPHTPAAEPAGDEVVEDPPSDAVEPPPVDTLVGEGVTVQLLDGVGDSGRVAAARDRLLELGYEIVFSDRAGGNYRRTTVLHDPEDAEAAKALLAADDRFTTTGIDPGFGAPAVLHVIVGADWPSG